MGVRMQPLQEAILFETANLRSLSLLLKSSSTSRSKSALLPCRFWHASVACGVNILGKSVFHHHVRVFVTCS
jgi:hypothetical protein